MGGVIKGSRPRRRIGSLIFFGFLVAEGGVDLLHLRASRAQAA